MAKYLIEDTTLRNMANGIREKTGKTESLTPERMTTEITSLTTEQLIKHVDIPSYVKEAVLQLVEKVRAVQTNDSITFLATSDSHYNGEQYEEQTQTDISNLHGTMAAKILSYALDFDFMACLGDSTCGSVVTTSELLHSQVKTLFDLLHESHADIPCFHAIGNHDTGIYYHEQMIEDGNTGIYVESGDYLYNTFTSLSASDDTVFGGEEYGGYCYRDFSDKKLRVFMLNTSEKLVYAQKDQGTLGAQRLWLANALLELNTKSDAAEWGFIILSHYPVDYGNTMPVSNLLEAYVKGVSFTITDPVTSYYVGDQTNATVDFTGKNSAKFIAQFHGHIHNFKYAKLNSNTSGSVTEYDAWRVAVPNMQYNRENYYGTISGVDFSDETTYSKTPDSAKDTSFVVNVINPSEEKIYSFCYGAGIDRVIGYAATVYYSVNANMTNASLKTNTPSVEEGGTYTNEITVNDGYELQSVTVTMGGEDITSSAYDNGLISIDIVTGNIVITAKAVAVTNYTNQIPLAVDTDGSIYNGTGYKSGYRIGSSGTESVHSTSDCFVTGYIPCKVGDVIRLQNVTFQKGVTDGLTSANQRIAFYDSSFTHLVQTNASYVDSKMTAVTDDSGIYTQITVDDTIDSSGDNANCAYFRLNGSYIGEDSIITINEEIENADIATGYTNVIDTVGYSDGYRLSTSTGELKAGAGYVTTGAIEVNQGDIIRTKGVDFRASSYTYCAKAQYTDGVFDAAGYLNEHSGEGFTLSFDDEGNMTFTVGTAIADGQELRFTGYGSGADLILTVNEEII